MEDGTAKLLTGVVGNKSYAVTFTNKLKEHQKFYVYHSSDNTIEKIFFNDPRIIDGASALSMRPSQVTCTAATMAEKVPMPEVQPLRMTRLGPCLSNKGTSNTYTYVEKTDESKAKETWADDLLHLRGPILLRMGK